MAAAADKAIAPAKTAATLYRRQMLIDGAMPRRRQAASAENSPLR